MAFDQKEAGKLLARCHRRCCICHRFCGSKMELDHMQPKAEGGPDDIENAIPLCFECHAEVHSYNDKHPRGRKFQTSELKLHKEQWLKLCEKNPAVFGQQGFDIDVGPVQAMVDELEFNAALAEQIRHGHELLPELHTDQFKRAIAAGAISGLQEELKSAVLTAYGAVERANAAVRRIESALAGSAGRSISGSGRTEATKAFVEVASLARGAIEKLLGLLGTN